MHNSRGASRIAPGFIYALLLLAAGPALADARADAKRVFRDGMSLISAGQIERGIADLKQAYAIKPHPDVLYDIAKAYVDLGSIPEALNYFRQYVATDPEDKDQVVSVMQRLQAAISGGTGREQPAAPATPPAAGQNVEMQKLLAQLQALITAQGQPPPPPAAVNPEDELVEAATTGASPRA